MKRVPGPTAPPRAFTMYLANNPTDVTALGEDAKAVWGRFKDDIGARDAVRDTLVKSQGGLCGYCEQRLTDGEGMLLALDQQIEHMAGPNISCGQTKGDKELAANCDPRTFPCSPSPVTVDLFGVLTPDRAACTLHGIDPDELDKTLNDILNLNCERLRKARQTIADNVRTWIIECGALLEGDSHWSQEQRDEFWTLMVAGRLQRNHHGHLRAFWTTERTMLDVIAEDWINNNESEIF